MAKLAIGDPVSWDMQYFGGEKGIRGVGTVDHIFTDGSYHVKTIHGSEYLAPESILSPLYEEKEMKDTVEIPIELVKKCISILSSHGRSEYSIALKECLPKPITNEELIVSLEKNTLIINCQEWEEIKKRLREVKDE